MSSWKKLKRYIIGKPSKTGLETDALPNRKTPIECSLGKMMIKLNPEQGTFEYLGEVGDGDYIKLDQSELQKIKEKMSSIEEENRLLKLKNEILLDLLSTTTLDAKYLEQTLVKIKNQGMASTTETTNQEEEERKARRREKKERRKAQEIPKSAVTPRNEYEVKKVVPRRQSTASAPLAMQQ